MTSPYKHAAAPLKKPKKLSPGEELLAIHLRTSKLDPVREFRFHPERDFRADFAFPERKLLIEVDGGGRLATIGKDGKPYAIGRHSQDKDLSKRNEAAILGFRVLYFSYSMVKSGEAISTIEKALT